MYFSINAQYAALSGGIGSLPAATSKKAWTMASSPRQEAAAQCCDKATLGPDYQARNKQCMVGRSLCRLRVEFTGKRQAQSVRTCRVLLKPNSIRVFPGAVGRIELELVV
jgi:hypothetical protein